MRAAVVSNPDARPVCADFPDPQQQPVKEPLRLRRCVSTDPGAAIDHVRIGSLPGAAASLPAALPRSPRIRLAGSGAGWVSKVRIAEVPEIIARFEECGGRHRARRASVDG